MDADMNDNDKKRDASWIKSWWEQDFDEGSFKFRTPPIYFVMDQKFGFGCGLWIRNLRANVWKQF